MKRMLLASMFVLVALVMSVASAEENRVMPNVAPLMLNDNFWINKLQEPHQVILDSKQIAAFNQAVITRQSDTIYDLRQYPRQLPKEKLISLIAVPKPAEDTEYVDGQPASPDYYRALATECNINKIAPVTPVSFAFTVTRANIRTYPTADCLTSQRDDREFDMLQETAIDPAEPVIILHQSLHKDWYYVQTYNYRGWLPAGALAVAANRQEWLEYLDSTEFLTVTARKLIIGDNEFAMGAKLPLADSKISPLFVKQVRADGKYAVKLPVRGPQGELFFELAAVPDDKQVVRGYLPYTRANILSQVFKLQGQRYGWGGMHGSWDCSSLVLDVYRSFGFKLPRNADEQELTAGNSITFSGNDRGDQIKGLEPGAAVYMPGHVMIYLGEEDGRPYIIHALGGYGTGADRSTVMRVVVSDLSLTLRSGKTFLNALTTGKQFQ